MDSEDAFTIYRLTITAVNGGNQLQIGELQLLNMQPAEDPTGIVLKGSNGFMDSNDLIFNLSGQRLSKPQRGINIVNGQKIIIKQ